MLTHTTTPDALALPLWAQIPSGVAAGLGIGVVAAIMGVAGGELLIPTVVLLFGEDIKAAGSLSLLVSPPTMLVAFARYSRDGSFAVLGANLRFTAVMALGSGVGAVAGGLLLGVFPDLVLIPALAVILLVSAVKLARHPPLRPRRGRRRTWTAGRPASVRCTNRASGAGPARARVTSLTAALPLPSPVEHHGDQGRHGDEEDDETGCPVGIPAARRDRLLGHITPLAAAETNAAKAPGATVKAGPSGFLESRMATCALRSATSTHWPPVSPLYDDLCQAAPPSGAHSTQSPPVSPLYDDLRQATAPSGAHSMHSPPVSLL